MLLRWAMLDRTVDLEQVLRGTAGRQASRRPGVEAPSRPVTQPPSHQDTQASRRPAVQASDLRIPFARDAIASRWEELIEAARGESAFLAQALAATSLESADAPKIVLHLDSAEPGAGITLENQRQRLTALFSRVLSAPVELEVNTGAPVQRPQRLSDEALRADRLKGLRRRDPALDAAAEALDLEIVE